MSSLTSAVLIFQATAHLLTSGKSNSLAALLEILSYLNQHDRKGEIIHGDVEYIAERIKTLAIVNAAKQILNGANLGVIGQPSDWMISSNADKAKVKLVNIPIKEVYNLISLIDENKVSLIVFPIHIRRITVRLKSLISSWERTG